MTRTVTGLSLHALPGPGYARMQWYRAVSRSHARAPLAWGHSCTAKSRFKEAKASFPVLYLAPDRSTALLEVRALLGHPRAGSITHVPGRWHVARVHVRLDRIADLRTETERARIQTTIQELTGDWVNYAVRTASSPDVASTPPAPTQQLGEDLYRMTPCQGFLTPSARNSTLPNLVVFPDRVRIDHDTLAIAPR